MTFSLIMGILATVVGLYATVPYIIAILNGKTKPHQFSWLIFVIMNGIVLFSQFFEGAKESVMITFTFFIGSLIIFILSLKYGTRDTSKWDRMLLAFALVTIVIWVLTRSNEVAIWLTLLIDVIATSMIILKLRKDPKSEDPKPWIIASIAYVFTTLSLAGTPFGILYVRPLYGLICDLFIVIAIYYFLAKSGRSKAAGSK